MDKNEFYGILIGDGAGYASSSICCDFRYWNNVKLGCRFI